MQCLSELPFNTDKMASTQHSLIHVLQPRINLNHAFSLFTFSKGNCVQKLLHDLKYKDQESLAHKLGQMIGERWAQMEIPNPDLLIPVPLHPKKFKKRGFNQSERLAHGISSILDVEVNNQILQRVKNSTSQTSLGRTDRWNNIEGAFKCTSDETEGLNIALVDDMITTGSTLEACYLALGVQKISVLSLAFEP